MPRFRAAITGVTLVRATVSSLHLIWGHMCWRYCKVCNDYLREICPKITFCEDRFRLRGYGWNRWLLLHLFPCPGLQVRLLDGFSCAIAETHWRRQRWGIGARAPLKFAPVYQFVTDSQSFNPLQRRGNCSAALNNMKLVHWPLMGGLHAHAGPSSLYQMYQPTHQRPVYQSPYCCIMVRRSAVLMCPSKG